MGQRRPISRTPALYRRRPSGVLAGIDRLIVDGTFFGENWYPEEHLSISEAIATGRDLNVENSTSPTFRCITANR